MPVIRNWDYFSAVHRDNLREVRIQFDTSGEEGNIDHNSMYNYKIGQKVFYSIQQGDTKRSHSIPATIIGVRFSTCVRYDIAIEIGNTGCMAVLKQIPGDTISATQFGEPEESVSVESVIETLPKEPALKVVEAEPLLDAPVEMKRWPQTYFNQQVTDMKPELATLMITSLKISGSFDFEYCKYQIGDVVKIDLGDEEATTIYGYVFAVNVSQHFSYDIAVPTPNGAFTILRDILPDDMFIVNQIPKGK